MKIRVKDGIMSEKFKDYYDCGCNSTIDMSGYTGTTKDTTLSGTVWVDFDEVTIKRIPSNYIHSCVVDCYAYDSYVYDSDDLEEIN